MILNKKLAVVVMVFSVFFSQAVMADSFCVISQLGVECTFEKESDCKNLAVTLDGECIKQSEFKKRFNAVPTNGDQNFCLVTDLSNECDYPDYDTCNFIAKGAMLRCVANQNKF
jgi:hypothetical protein